MDMILLYVIYYMCIYHGCDGIILFHFSPELCEIILHLFLELLYLLSLHIYIYIPDKCMCIKFFGIKKKTILTSFVV